MRYPLDLQLFADDKKGDVIDADKELEKVERLLFLFAGNS